MINGSDFRTVWARHGNAAAEKISPNAKARMFVVQPAGRTIITQHDGKVSCAAKIIFRRQKNAGRAPSRPSANKKAGVKPAFSRRMSVRSIFGGDRATPAKPVVHADLDGVFVVPEAPAGDIRRGGDEGGIAEIVILLFGLGRPVGRKHVFEASADRVAVLVIAIGGEGLGRAGNRHADVVAVTPGVTALGVKQRRTPGVADPTGHRAELVVVGGHQRTARE